LGVTLQDVAAETGYAVSTVSNALNGNKTCFASRETRRLIKDSARRLGYRPNYFARALRRQQSMVVGAAGSLFGCQIVGFQFEGFIAPLRRRDYTVLLANTRSEGAMEADVIAELSHKKVDGLVFATNANADALREMLPLRLPHVLIVEAPVAGFACVVIDRAASMRNAMKRLRELGHRRVAFFGDRAANPGKVEGYLAGMAAGGAGGPILLECSMDPGAVAAFLAANPDRLHDVTAIMAANDRIGIEAMTALAALGRAVPRDCSVVGYDDINIALSVRPALSSLRQPREEVGWRGARPA